MTIKKRLHRNPAAGDKPERKRKWNIQRLGKVAVTVLLVFVIAIFLLATLGTVAHAAGLVDDTVNAANEYSKYPLDNYQLDFYVDTGWDWLPWNWLDGIGKQVMYGLYAITNFIWTISLYLSNATGYLIQEAYSLDFISATADSIGKNMQTLAGVTPNGLSSEGFYIGFLLILILVVGIYVAYTGGTIGMQRSEQGYIPVSGHLQRQLALMPEFHRPEMPDFTIHEYTPLMDSSDMTPEDWQHIAEDIKAHYDDYDGFVILHGTDTMAYTASALSFMLENLGKPVIVTGSQIPLAELRSDGQINLLNALYVAANYPINEVTLFFNNRLYRGNRTTKAHADGFDAFASPNLPPLLEAGIHIRRLNTPPAPHGEGELIVHPITPQPIGVVTIYPGISADVVRNFLRQPVKALILRSYGVGNAPQNNAVPQELHEASDRGIVVVNLTQCMSGKVNMGGYATGNALAHAGVIGGADMTVEATLTKLHYLLSQELDTETIRKAMSQNLRGELTPDD